MANSVISPIESSRSNAANSASASSALAKNNSVASMVDTVTGAFSKALTSGGKASFANPGAQKDFQSNLHSAIEDMIKGSQSGDKDQMMKGMQDMLALLAGLSKSEDQNSAKDGKSCGGGGSGSGGAQNAQGASPAAGAPSTGSSEDDKKKKLLELIQMLLSMGVPPEMIAQLMQAMGMPPEETQQLLAQASQSSAKDADKGGPNTIGSSTMKSSNALMA
jgi:hypothetical protein